MVLKREVRRKNIIKNNAAVCLIRAAKEKESATIINHFNFLSLKYINDAYTPDRTGRTITLSNHNIFPSRNGCIRA